MDLKNQIQDYDWIVFEPPNLSCPTILRTSEGRSSLVKVFVVLLHERSKEAKWLLFDVLILLM